MTTECPITGTISNNNNLLAQPVDEIYMFTNSIISNKKNLLARLLDEIQINENIYIWDMVLQYLTVNE